MAGVGALVLILLLVPTPAHADVGSTIVSRLWESLLGTVQGRLQSNAPFTVTLLQEAEKIFLGQTVDVTIMGPVRDVYTAMRSVGLLLLGLCTVISLAQLVEIDLTGNSSSLSEWVRRFCIATFMTLGGIHFYGLWIRVFNLFLTGFRQYLDTHWQGPDDSSYLFTALLPQLSGSNSLLGMVFVVLVLIVLFVLWFLIGGIRLAELALSVIVAPLVWPVYLIPALDDLPKAAFRGFLGLNAMLLLIVGMLRLAVRMVLGGGLANTVWNFVPAIAMLLMTVFLPSIIKRLVGQGNTGAGGLATAVSVLAGLKGVSMVASTGAAGAAAVASPPAAAAVPSAPTSPSAYPPVPITGGSGMAPHRPASSPAQMGERWVDVPAALSSGQTVPAGGSGGTLGPGDPRLLEAEEFPPGSGSFRWMGAIEAWKEGWEKGKED